MSSARRCRVHACLECTPALSQYFFQFPDIVPILACFCQTGGLIPRGELESAFFNFFTFFDLYLYQRAGSPLSYPYCTLHPPPPPTMGMASRKAAVGWPVWGGYVEILLFWGNTVGKYVQNQVIYYIAVFAFFWGNINFALETHESNIIMGNSRCPRVFQLIPTLIYLWCEVPGEKK